MTQQSKIRRAQLRGCSSFEKTIELSFSAQDSFSTGNNHIKYRGCAMCAKDMQHGSNFVSHMIPSPPCLKFRLVLLKSLCRESHLIQGHSPQMLGCFLLVMSRPQNVKSRLCHRPPTLKKYGQYLAANGRQQLLSRQFQWSGASMPYLIAPERNWLIPNRSNDW